MPGVDQAEPARPRAALAVDHERGRAVGPALEDVGAARLLAHRHEPEVAHGPPQPEELVAHAGRDPQPRRLARRSGQPRTGVHPGLAQPDRGAAAPATRSGQGAGVRGGTTSWSMRTGGPRHVLALEAPVGGPAPHGVAHEDCRPPRASAPRPLRRPATSPPCPSMPHGTMRSNHAMSGSTLSASPCIDRPRVTRTPMAQILRGAGPSGVDPHAGIPVQPPGAHAELGQRVDHDLLDGVDVARHRPRRGGHVHHGIGDELARPVVGDVPAPVGRARARRPPRPGRPGRGPGRRGPRA